MRPLLMVLLQLMALMAFFAPPGKNVGGRVQGALRVGGNWTLAARMCQCELGCKDEMFEQGSAADNALACEIGKIDK